MNSPQKPQASFITEGDSALRVNEKSKDLKEKINKTVAGMASIKGKEHIQNSGRKRTLKKKGFL